MEQLLGASRRLRACLAPGAVAYLGLNLVLIAAEAQWHVLYRLTFWDVSAIKALATAVAKLLHPS